MQYNYVYAITQNIDKIFYLKKKVKLGLIDSIFQLVLAFTVNFNNVKPKL